MLNTILQKQPAKGRDKIFNGGQPAEAAHILSY
jgi:hypothetical protein